MAARTTHEARRLTPRQLEILRLIRDYRRQNGYSPTMQEIADTLDVTKVTVFEHVGALQKKGLLRRAQYKARSLELTSKASFPEERSTALPLAGRIAAGRPIEAIEQDESVDLESLFTARNAVYALQVTGDSMIDEHIHDGDYVVIEKRENPRNGETVVALLEDGEATLKKFYREGKRVRLQPANPKYEPIIVDDVKIQGVVIGVIRRY